jgi:2-polyprenyl-6-methoxyphenol hydroxylase-like FAD-dependent oxidoreductase
MRTTSVLISGAGIAGATAAHWLDKHGFDVTVVELAEQTRSSGAPVDIRRQALDIASRMGILDTLREAATHNTRAVIVDASGRTIARLAGQNSGRSTSGLTEIEVARPTLAAGLLGTLDGRAELIFGDSIAGLQQDGDGVDVSFRSGGRRRFGLVIGADGVHSVTRKLIFGAETLFSRHLGLYYGGMPLPELPDPPTDVQIFNQPGRSATIHPAHGVPLGAFIFRAAPLPDFDPRDIELHRRMIIDRYADDGWRVPELLGYLRSAPDIYFDSVSRVSVPRWWSGRIGLAGDAASCVSLLGDGSTKAIIGGYTLAEELAAADDHEAGFRRYQERHQRLISSRLQVSAAAQLLVPSGSAGIALRNAALRVLNPRGHRESQTAAS